jgi:uncharacterized protein (DUF2235 family)
MLTVWPPGGIMTEINENAVADQLAGDGEGAGASSGGTPRPPRKFVLFADGTGNAFTTQESNVWRLYEALDRTRPDQVAYYIKGVGTSGWRPLAALDGATGIGVPSNVRKLYRFLCWNWQPNDEIHIFGFSRGAFTARTLAGLIASQGLLPAVIDDSPVTHAEMERNVKAAWREYRRDTVPWYKSLPTIPLMRLVRDLALGAYHTVRRHRSYATVRAAMDEKRQNVRIKFLGLFDTVEAFGVPVEELRTAIDWAIWPISFRNQDLTDKVDSARHALALDDERTSFHPIRINHPEHVDETTVPRIKEVWFSGVHSDVGGGYPDGSLSYVPLAWMAGEIGQGLRFQPGRIQHFDTYQSAIGPMHDSRSGAAVMYRYGPRPIGEDKKTDGGAPIVHLGVVERMLHGCDNYAPIMLPASAKVLLPDGKVLPLTQDDTRTEMKSAYQNWHKGQTAPSDADADAFEEMSKPDAAMTAQALDVVWWRRFAYFTLLATILLLAAWPWVATTAVDILKDPTAKIDAGEFNALTVIRGIDYGVGAVVGPIADLFMGFLPSYVGPWLKIAVYYPFATTIVFLLVVLAWRTNAYLRDRIQERAQLAWDTPKRMVADNLTAVWLLPVARWMRQNAAPVRKLFTNLVVPGIFLFAIFGTALLAISRSYYNWRAGTGEFCTLTNSVTVVGDQPITAPATFNTSDPCWTSGLWVEKGRKYRIWIDARDPWFDQTIMSGVNGYKLNDFAHIAGLPLRRWYKADWFQPVLRIGAPGDAELPLEAINVMPADELPRPRNPITPDDKQTLPVRVQETDDFKSNSDAVRRLSKLKCDEPIPADLLPAAQQVWRKQGLTERMVAEFVAGASGEVFLYVNDAAQIFPFLGALRLFYKNNSGAAQVTLQRMALPPQVGK